MPGHRLNSGPFGTMGVGLPFGIGAKVAKPDAQVVVLHGDGSFGMNAMEIDTRRAPQDPGAGGHQQQRRVDGRSRPQNKPGRNLGYTRWDKVAMAVGAHGEHVEKPDDIRPALERALASGKPAVVNVDHRLQGARHDRALLRLLDVGGIEPDHGPKALDGIRVLDLTQYEAGPELHGDARPGSAPRSSRSSRPPGSPHAAGSPSRADVDSHFFILLNANKKGVTLNLKYARGRQMFAGPGEDQPTWSSRTWGPGAMERLGLGYEALAAINPRIISASIKGFSSGGPYADYKSFEWIAQAMAA